MWRPVRVRGRASDLPRSDGQGSDSIRWALEPLGVVLIGVGPSASDPIERRHWTGRAHYSSSAVFGEAHIGMMHGSVGLSLSPKGGVGLASEGFCPLCCLLDYVGPSLCGV
jgi:hypothetical protein